MPKIIGAASEAHRMQMQRLVDFAEAESVEYVDETNGERYILFKKGVYLTLKMGCQDRAGFLVVS